MIQTGVLLTGGVFDHLCSRWHTPRVDLFATRFNNKLPKFVSPVLDQTAWRVDLLSLQWEELDLSSSVSPRPGPLQGGRPGLLTDDPDCPRMAKHALVLGSGQPVGSSTTVAATTEKPVDATLQRVSPQGFLQSKSSCLTP